MISKSLRWSVNVASMLLVIVLVLTLYNVCQVRKHPAKVPSICGYNFFSVLSGSMQPLMEAGDLIVTRNVNAEELRIEDVITYRVDEGFLVTHRIVDIAYKNGKLFFKTKGDANKYPDKKPVLSEQLVGTFVFKIPNLGYVANFISTKICFMIFIIFPITIITITEFKNRHDS